MIQAVRGVVHENLNPKAAFQMYRDLGGTVTHVENPVPQGQRRPGGAREAGEEGAREGRNRMSGRSSDSASPVIRPPASPTPRDWPPSTTG